MQLHGFYVLDGHAVREERDLQAWAQRWAVTDRRVALTAVAEGVEVSTVFVGIPPLHFETMVFWPRSLYDNTCARYATWEQAEQGHAAMVAQVRQWIIEERRR